MEYSGLLALDYIFIGIDHDRIETVVAKIYHMV